MTWKKPLNISKGIFTGASIRRPAGSGRRFITGSSRTGRESRRKFPLGDSLEDARDRLGELRTLNKGRHDSDKERQEREKAKIRAMTLSEWLNQYLELVKNTASFETKDAQCAPLKRLLGQLPLAEVTKVRILEYKQRRLTEPWIRHGKPVEGTKITGATVNREVSCLKTAINLAADEGLCEGAPRVKKERETARERILTEKEYPSLLGVSPRWHQRVLIGANETALDQGVMLRLTWDCVEGWPDQRQRRSRQDGRQSAGRDLSGSR